MYLDHNKWLYVEISKCTFENMLRFNSDSILMHFTSSLNCKSRRDPCMRKIFHLVSSNYETLLKYGKRPNKKIKAKILLYTNWDVTLSTRITQCIYSETDCPQILLVRRLRLKQLKAGNIVHRKTHMLAPTAWWP